MHNYLSLSAVEVTSEIQPEFYCSEEPCCTKQGSIESNTEECSMLASTIAGKFGDSVHDLASRS